MKIEVQDFVSPPVDYILQRWSKNSDFDGNYYWRFNKDWKVSVTIDGVNHDFLIERGFCSDGGSIPRYTGFMRGLAFAGYFVHDLIYTTHVVDRDTADNVLKAILLYEGVSDSDAEVIFAAVRVAGEIHW